MNAIPIYFTLSFCASLFFSLIISMNLVYQVVTVGLDPLQLVLMGTILEATVFVFEIPTGVVADLKSRKLSIVIGYLLMGLGFIIEGSFPIFAAVALAQIVWGFGYTFTSGAIQAWIVDEIGEPQVAPIFLRGTQLRQIGGFVGIPLSVGLASIQLSLPVVTGGVLLVLLALYLEIMMPEDGFKPTPTEGRSTWSSMRETTLQAYRMARGKPVLLLIFLTGLFFGLYSEGVDRLWTPHLLDNFTWPLFGNLEPVVWFGIIRAVDLLAGMIGIQLTKQYLDVTDSGALIRMLMACASGMIFCLIGVSISGYFFLALVLYWLFGALRSIIGPIESIWINRQIDNSEVRATVLSAMGQVDAIGQVFGGPMIGAIGRTFSIRKALCSSALFLTPVLPLYAKAARIGLGSRNRGDTSGAPNG